jgi:transposase
LVEEHGFTGCESNVRRFVRTRRPAKTDNVFMSIAHQIGEEAQVDFGEAIVELAGQKTRIHLFCFQLCHSTRRFVRAYRTERQEALFDGLVRAFRTLGGVPKRLTFDNPKTLVTRVFRGHLRQEHPDFIAFRSHYLFDSHFCNPAKGNEKGHVEGLVGCVRRNALVPIPVVSTLSELNAHLDRWCADDQARIYKGEPVRDRFESERAHLKPLPVFDYSCCRRVSCTVGRYSEVSVGTNRYSVPAAYAHHSVSILAYPERIEVFCRDEKIAEHERCYGQRQEILDPTHYLPLLAKRPGLLDHGVAFREWNLPDCFEQTRRRLKEKKGGGEREYIRILRLHERYTTDQIVVALKEAETLGCLGADAVEMLLLARLDCPKVYPVLNLKEDLSSLRVTRVDLKQFDRLAEVCA